MSLDFSNQDLRSKSFKNQDLSGANFSHVKCGQKWRYKLILFGFSISMSMIIGGLLVVNSIFMIGFVFFKIKWSFLGFLLILFVILLLGGGIIIYKNQINNFIEYLIFILILNGLYQVIFFMTGVNGIIIAGFFITMLILITLLLMLTISLTVIIGVTVTIIGTLMAAIMTLISIDNSKQEAVIISGVIIVFLVITILSVYLKWFMLHREVEFTQLTTILKQLKLWLNSYYGTNFEQANLSFGHFHNADLKNSNLKNTITTRANWRGCKNLEFAYLKGTILEVDIIRKLLISGNGQNQSFVGLNLTGAYLKDANLENTDFTDANLTNADLRNANLSGAKLSRANLLQADLSGANLTGAYLDNAIIDKSTLLENIKAEYIYLPDRYPTKGFFKIGEFAKLFQKPTTKILKLIVKDQLELDNLLLTIKMFKKEFPEFAIKNTEKNKNSTIVQIIAPLDFSDEKLNLQIKHHHRMKLLKVEYDAKLIDQQSCIDNLKSRISKLNTLIHLKSQPVTVNVENKAMTDSRNLNITNSTLTGNTLNLGEISGQVQNSIQQIPANNPEQNQLKETLSKLQQWVEKLPEKAAKPEDKADVLQQVDNIAKSVQASPEEHQGILRTALKVFKGFKSDVSETLNDSKDILSEFDDLISKLKSFSS